MSATTEGRGHGKLILAGEHAVVYGHPAIAFAVDLSTTVELTARPGPTTVRGTLDDPRLQRAVEAIVGPEGHEVRIASDLPIGRGMGSSAALAVALARAAAGLRGDSPDDDALFDQAMPVERVFHGNPSGLDVAVSIRGGVVAFTRDRPPRLQSLSPGDWSVVVLDSGSAGDTAALVQGVADRRPAVDPILAEIGLLAIQALVAVDKPALLGRILSENHRLLQRIGVSTPELDALVDLARDAGALGAKLSGAGGGGVVIALVDTPDLEQRVLEAARARGRAAWRCRPHIAEAP